MRRMPVTLYCDGARSNTSLRKSPCKRDPRLARTTKAQIRLPSLGSWSYHTQSLPLVRVLFLRLITATTIDESSQIRFRDQRGNCNSVVPNGLRLQVLETLHWHMLDKGECLIPRVLVLVA